MGWLWQLADIQCVRRFLEGATQGYLSGLAAYSVAAIRDCRKGRRFRAG
jgi:hypothetical protein